MDSDGSHRTGVTNDEAVERSPHWADGGRSLVFIREAKDKTEIVKHYLPDNADRTIVTLETEKISQLTASPASALVAFVVKAEEGTSLQVVPLEDAKSRKLMAVPATASVQSLCWLGDGHTLALVLVQKDPQPPVKASSGKPGKEGKAKTEDRKNEEGRTPAVGILVVDAETGRARSLTTEARDRFVAGCRRPGAIAFLRGESLYVFDSVDSDKATPRRVVEKVKPLPPVWSPEGTQIAYWVTGDKPVIGVVSATGGEPQALPLPDEAVPSDGLAWSPDGTQIGFLKQQVDGEVQRRLFYVVELSGGKDRRLTEALADHQEVVWGS
jgi:Tol biopolymer transport system component